MEDPLARAAAAVRSEGYAFVAGSDVLSDPDVADGLPAFAAVWSGLPADPYLTDGEPFRFRRHGRLLSADRSDRVDVLPPTDYVQSSAHNPLFGGVRRRFAPIEWDDSVLRVCAALVALDRAIIPFDGPCLVNLHLVRIVGAPGRDGAPAPEGPHRDGFDFISVHLVAVDTDQGGVTSIVGDDGSALATGTLRCALDSVIVDDRRLLHYTSPIGAADRDVHRDVLLLSFEPAPADLSGAPSS